MLPKKAREIIGLAILILAGIFFALILAEIGARLLPAPEQLKYAETMLQCDRLLGWRGKSNLTRNVNMHGYRHKVARNSQGMHDREYTLDKKPDVFRILILGDSYIEAIGVEEHETSQAILEKILNDRVSDIQFEVISAGIHAWSPNQELMYYRSEGQFFEPDLVLAFWVPANDLTNMLPYQILTVEGTHCFSPYFAVCNGQFDPAPYFPVPGIEPTWKTCSTNTKFLTTQLNRLYNHSRLYQRLSDLLIERENHLDFQRRFAPWVIADSSDETLNYAYQLTGHIYQQLATEANQNGAATAFVIVPFNQAVYSQVYPEVAESLKQNFANFDDADPNLPNTTFTTLMQNQKLKVFDMQPHFVNYIKETGKDLHWPGDIHWNKAGNRLAAETVAEWLIDESLVPIHE